MMGATSSWKELSIDIQQFSWDSPFNSSAAYRPITSKNWIKSHGVKRLLDFQNGDGGGGVVQYHTLSL